jgi:transposase
MAERKMLIGHLEADGVYGAYRGEREAVRRSHLQVIWLLLSGSTVAEVSAVTGLCGRWILKLMDRWNDHGLAGLGDRRRSNSGAEPLLDAAGLAALAAALEVAPADGGLWSGRQVAAWMSAYLGREVSPKRGLDYLHRLDYSLQQPRPRHTKAAGPEERAAFKKNSAKRWRKRSAKRPGGRSRSGPSTSTASA